VPALGQVSVLRLAKLAQTGVSFRALRFEAASSSPTGNLSSCLNIGTGNGIIRVLNLDRSLSPPRSAHRTISASVLGVSWEGVSASEPLMGVPESPHAAIVDFHGGVDRW
jgi:hypothetical protein